MRKVFTARKQKKLYLKTQPFLSCLTMAASEQIQEDCDIDMAEGDKSDNTSTIICNNHASHHQLSGHKRREPDKIQNETEISPSPSCKRRKIHQIQHSINNQTVDKQCDPSPIQSIDQKIEEKQQSSIDEQTMILPEDQQADEDWNQEPDEDWDQQADEDDLIGHEENKPIDLEETLLNRDGTTCWHCQKCQIWLDFDKTMSSWNNCCFRCDSVMDLSSLEFKDLCTKSVHAQSTPKSLKWDCSSCGNSNSGYKDSREYLKSNDCLWNNCTGRSPYGLPDLGRWHPTIKELQSDRGWIVHNGFVVFTLCPGCGFRTKVFHNTDKNFECSKCQLSKDKSQTIPMEKFCHVICHYERQLNGPKVPIVILSECLCRLFGVKVKCSFHSVLFL